MARGNNPAFVSPEISVNVFDTMGEFTEVDYSVPIENKPIVPGIFF